MTPDVSPGRSWPNLAAYRGPFFQAAIDALALAACVSVVIMLALSPFLAIGLMLVASF